jgi:hypothetical protein
MSDQFHYHEVLDRLSVMMGMLSDYVSNTPVMEDEPELLKLVDEAHDKLAEAYQLCGKLKFEKFSNVPVLPATPEAVIAFVGSHYDSMTESEDPSATRFQVSVHDLLSSFRDWQE